MPVLGARGRQMWRDLVDEANPPGPAQRVLIEEACRIADRLDRLDAQLRGYELEWLRLAGGEDERPVVVIVDKALSEARQQAVALKQLVAELRQSQQARSEKPSTRAAAASPAAPTPRGVRGVSDLTARIRARSSQTAG